MYDRPDGLDHPHRAIGLEDISPHVDADGAAFDRIIGQFQSFQLRRFFATGYDHWNWAALDQLLEIIALVGLYDVSAKLRGNAAGQA